MQPRMHAQQRLTTRRHRPSVFSIVLGSLTLSIMLLALALPLGAAAEEEEERRETRRVEASSTPATIQAVVLLDEAVPPDPPGCPEGFVPASPPLNPALGCIANTIASSSGDSAVVVVAGSDTRDNPDPFCPPGFEPAVPPLNPALGCVGTGLTYTTGEGESQVFVATLDESVPPGHGCPDGWVPAEPPLNPALGCINNTIGTGAGTSGGSVQFLHVGSGSLEHPGHCAEGYSYRLVLRENADGSLTWLYTCVPDGVGVGGPDEITSGQGGRNGVMEVSGLKFEVDVVD